MKLPMLRLSEVIDVSRMAMSYLSAIGSEPGGVRRFVKSVLRYVATYDPVATEPRHLPWRLLHDLVSGSEAIPICFSHKVEPKSLPYGEAYALGAITASLRPRKVFEIGTFTGGGTIIMAQQAGPDCRIYTLDLPPEQTELHLRGLEEDPPEADTARIGERFRGTQYETQITQLYGDSASFDFSPFRGEIDLVFVDGSHSYEYVKNDTRQALRMLSEHGVIIWDDCSPQYPGVMRALNDLGRSHPVYRLQSTRFALYMREHDPKARRVASPVESTR